MKNCVIDENFKMFWPYAYTNVMFLITKTVWKHCQMWINLKVGLTDWENVLHFVSHYNHTEKMKPRTINGYTKSNDMHIISSIIHTSNSQHQVFTQFQIQVTVLKSWIAILLSLHWSVWHCVHVSLLLKGGSLALTTQQWLIYPSIFQPETEAVVAVSRSS